jgi:hypothetical protein
MPSFTITMNLHAHTHTHTPPPPTKHPLQTCRIPASLFAATRQRRETSTRKWPHAVGDYQTRPLKRHLFLPRTSSRKVHLEKPIFATIYYQCKDLVRLTDDNAICRRRDGLINGRVWSTRCRCRTGFPSCGILKLDFGVRDWKYTYASYSVSDKSGSYFSIGMEVGAGVLIRRDSKLSLEWRFAVEVRQRLSDKVPTKNPFTWVETCHQAKATRLKSVDSCFVPTAPTSIAYSGSHAADQSPKARLYGVNGLPGA